MSEEQKPVESAIVESEPNPVEEWLRTASVEDIWKNDRIRGIYGSRQQADRDRIEHELGEKSQREARIAAQQELDDLAQNDIMEFQRRYLSKREQERLATELDQLKTSTRSEFAKTLGRGYAALPEWNNLTSAEQETLALAVSGKSDDNALVAFNAAALDVIAERRAAAKNAKFMETQLAQEREAIRQEESSKRMKGSARPQLDRNGAQPRPARLVDLPDRDFKVEYEKKYLGRQ